MQFIETSIFTRQVTSLLTDDEYSQLQVALFTHPEMGAIIPRSGGVRAVYYWVVAEDLILMLFMYSKNEKDDLTTQQLKVLREIVEKEFK